MGWQFHARARLDLVTEPEKPLLPPGLYIQQVSERETFERCFWFDERQKLYGGVDNFLTHGRAYVLIGPEQSILSECYASIGGGHSEIGVVTHPEHRGKGYATMLLAEAISLLKQEQLCVDWSCNLDNQASLRSAFKLGFELQCHDMFMVPCRGNIS